MEVYLFRTHTSKRTLKLRVKEVLQPLEPQLKQVYEKFVVDKQWHTCLSLPYTGSTVLFVADQNGHEIHFDETDITKTADTVDLSELLECNKPFSVRLQFGILSWRDELTDGLWHTETVTCRQTMKEMYEVLRIFKFAHDCPRTALPNETYLGQLMDRMVTYIAETLKYST